VQQKHKNAHLCCSEELPIVGAASARSRHPNYLLSAFHTLLLSIFGFGTTLPAHAKYEWALPQWLPEPVVPPDNPITAAKVLLGRYLFYDPRLSVSGTVACATCHQQRFAFSSGPRPIAGVSGHVPLRKAPTLTNVAYFPTLTWEDPHVHTLEEQMRTPLFYASPSEMGDGSSRRQTQLVRLFRSAPPYRTLFKQVFPDAKSPYTIRLMLKALASFERTLISYNSPYDRYAFEHQSDAISRDAKQGAALFFGEEVGCHHCHSGINFTPNFRAVDHQSSLPAYANIGLYNVNSASLYPARDLGLFNATAKRDDLGSFRIPTLRNISLTMPYMHDRSVASLSEVVDHYRVGGRYIRAGPNGGNGALNIHKSSYIQGFAISELQKRQLESFLNSLTDEGFIHDPRFSDPWNHQNVRQRSSTATAISN
jgi:cytochrome c peroxidase